MQYQLNVNISPQALKSINAAGQKVTITKSTGASEKQVAWVAFTAFEENSVIWDENYGLYASNTKIENGARIVEVSTTEANDQTQYPFHENSFGTGLEKLKQGQFGIVNKNGDELTFGMMQAIGIEGAATKLRPYNAVSILNQEQATFQPVETIQIFLAENIDSGTVITSVQGNQLTVIYSGTTTKQTVKYDMETSSFVLVPA